MSNNTQDKIKVSFTCTRETADEIHSAIEFYINRVGDVEDERENESGIINALEKAQRVIERAVTNNKAI